MKRFAEIEQTMNEGNLEDAAADMIEALTARVNELRDGIREIRDGEKTADEVYRELVAPPSTPEQQSP